MRIYDIENLIKENNDLYNLIQMTFQYNPEDTVRFSEHKVTRSQEMRIDNVCQEIYGNTNYVDILCSVNNIDNPLNIKEGEILIYPEASDINQLRYDKVDDDDTLSTVINTEKRTKTDPNRKKYNDNRQSIPPTILPQQTDPVNLKGTKFNLGEGLF